MVSMSGKTIIVNYDEWRADFIAPNGELIEKDVLWIRASSGDLQYQIPLLRKQSKQDIKDAKAILFERISRVANCETPGCTHVDCQAAAALLIDYEADSDD